MKKVIIIFGFVFFLIFFIRFFFGGDEDTWICQKGEWIKHGNPSYPKPIISCNGITPLPKNKEDCIKIGGIWEKQGPDPFETCDRKTIDRGNLCRDNKECEGWCQVELSKEELKTGMSGKLNIKKKYGQCSVYVVELGCFGMMEKGKVKVICID